MTLLPPAVFGRRGRFVVPQAYPHRVGSNKVTDEKLAQMLASPRAITLPVQAYGPQPIEWAETPASVWAWISWADRPAERVVAVATGWNDRVVVIEWDGPGGSRSVVVWRNAVTRRAPEG